MPVSGGALSGELKLPYTVAIDGVYIQMYRTDSRSGSSVPPSPSPPPSSFSVDRFFVIYVNRRALIY